MRERERRFQAVNSGAKHVVFIKCRDPVDPCLLVHHMLSDMLSTQVKVCIHTELMAMLLWKESKKLDCIDLYMHCGLTLYGML